MNEKKNIVSFGIVECTRCGHEEFYTVDDEHLICNKCGLFYENLFELYDKNQDRIDEIYARVGEIVSLKTDNMFRKSNKN